ncbi:MAG: acyltransferase [Candidatus Sedimenticola sp. (ex Thyasira tokunagai)]
MSEESLRLIEEQSLGQQGVKLHLMEIEEVQLACQRLVEQAVRRVDIFTFDLDAQLFDRQPFLEAVKQLAIGGPLSQINILLQDNHRVQTEGHRLLELARRLTSKIEIRRPHADHIDQLENYLLADECGYLIRPLYTSYEASTDFSDRYTARGMTEKFMKIWECSEPDTVLRRLYL